MELPPSYLGSTTMEGGSSENAVELQTAYLESTSSGGSSEDAAELPIPYLESNRMEGKSSKDAAELPPAYLESIIMEEGSSSDAVVSSFRQRLLGTETIPYVERQCIYKVPEWLKDHVTDPRAYTPEVVSFGHYHRGNPGLTEMENHKWRCLNKMLAREQKEIYVFVSGTRNILPDVRLCYEVDPIGNREIISEDEFVEMLVLDGCFMLECLGVLSRGLEDLQYELDDPVFSKKTKMEVIGRDMIKLENQLPIVVLKTLLTLQYKEKRPVELESDLTRMILNALSPIWVSSEVLTGEKSNDRGERVVESTKDGMLHCLDIFRSNLLFELTPDLTTSTTNFVAPTTSINIRIWKREQKRTSIYENSRTKSVEDLRAAGVKFKIRKRKPFWDLKFDKDQGVLEVPPMKINKTSKTIFLNLIAYEQCHFNSSKEMVITDYLAFMDTLINTVADVSRLYKTGIIIPQLGNNDEVADFFNNLVKNAYVISEDGWLKDIYTQLNEYCDIERHIWCADLRQNYVKSPWVFTSIAAAIILFLLTAIQATYAVLAYHKPPK